jgi:uncharacterized membrane protein YkoI
MNIRRIALGFLLAVFALALPAAIADAPKTAAEEQDEKMGVIKGSIKVEGKKSDPELAKLAKISMADAKSIALKEIKSKDADKKVSDSELEVEQGYLVYSIEIKVKDQKGFEEILVDAGNGKVLSRDHEDDDDEEEEED